MSMDNGGPSLGCICAGQPFGIHELSQLRRHSQRISPLAHSAMMGSRWFSALACSTPFLTRHHILSAIFIGFFWLLIFIYAELFLLRNQLWNPSRISQDCSYVAYQQKKYVDVENYGLLLRQRLRIQEYEQILRRE
jgi:hypothetical protein